MEKPSLYWAGPWIQHQKGYEYIVNNPWNSEYQKFFTANKPIYRSILPVPILLNCFTNSFHILPLPLNTMFAVWLWVVPDDNHTGVQIE